MKNIWFVAVALGLVVLGCGGSSTGSTTSSGNVAGVVFDQNGGVVANATVWTTANGTRTTYSNITGAFNLTTVPGTDIIVQAQITRSGQQYYGQNLASVTSGEQAKSVNIAVYPSNQLASIHGSVRDSSGNLLSGVHIFARQNSGNVLSSAVAISDNSGNYTINSLGSGIDYAVQANGLGYGSATTVVNLTANTNRTLDLTIPNGSSATLNPPTGLSAVAWTSPAVSTRSANYSNVLASIKQALHYPVSGKKVTRTSTLGNPIEIDLSFTGVINNLTLGYGVYRQASTASFANIDLLRDPLADFFADQDSAIQPDITYTYGVTTLSTSYNGSTGESGYSATASATPLNDLVARTPSVTSGQVNFAWNAVNGGAGYQVVIYSELPTIGVSPVVITPSTASTSYAYTGSALLVGQQYYYAVIGTDSTGNAHTVSALGTFTR